MQGRVAFPNKDLDDFVILRSDGTPTYMLAVVVDDHDMGVTHVIRGDDHLTNAGRQTIIYEAMGWPAPEWAHIPLIHGPDGAKLSKRHGALGVEAYRAMGYLPEALRNYLARLGWAHGDDEIFSTEQAAEWFDLDAIGKGAGALRFRQAAEPQRPLHPRGRRRRAAGSGSRRSCRRSRAGRRSPRGSTTTGASACSRLMPALKERAKTLVELFDGARVPRGGAADPARREGRGAARRRGAKRCSARLSAHARGDAPGRRRIWRRRVRAFAEAGLKLGKVAQPLRAALTGSATSPPIFDVLVALGREESLGTARGPGG